MARTTSREGPTLPSPGDPDRKRVLNILAQRRYRQRRRQRFAELEARAKGSTSPEGASSEPAASASDTETASPPVTIGGVPIETQATPEIVAFEDFTQPHTSHDAIQFAPTSSDYGRAPFMGFETFPAVNTAGVVDLEQYPDFDLTTTTGADQIGTIMLTNATRAPLSMPLQIPHEPEVPLMKVVSVCHHVAIMLGCAQEVWDRNFRWTLDPIACSGVPAAFQPTPAQIRIPHHPLLDLIPFPSVRSKIIVMLALPQESRPPNAKDEMALMDIVADMEDEVEGFRISGTDGYREEDWEVGAAFARNWWWCLDRQTIKRTNEWRLQRGAPRLLGSSG